MTTMNLCLLIAAFVLAVVYGVVTGPLGRRFSAKRAPRFTGMAGRPALAARSA
jgi:hypothetical protein